MAKSNGGAKSAPATLPKSLLVNLPSAVEVMKHATAISALLPKLEKELAAAEKDGAVTLARAFVVLHRMAQRVKDELQISDSGATFGPLMQKYKTERVPAAFEQAGITHVPLAEGFRVGVASTFRASIKPDMKVEAYAFLREIGLPDIITETVNASTLSAAVRREIEDKNREFPEELFNVATVPNVSVTSTGK